MADLRGTYKSPKGSPYFDYDISYTETSRNGSSAKYRVNLRVRMTSSYSKYGYGIRAYVSINGAKSEKQIKSAGGMWSGSGWQGTWSFDVTASAGTGGGTLPAEVKVWGTDGGSAPNMTIGGKTVSLSTWNTAPYWTTDDGNINDWKQDRIIPENTGTVTVNLPHATDKEGNRIYYDVYRYVNGSSNAKILSGGNGNSINDNISSFGQGTEIKYKFCCHDGSLWAPDHWSWKYVKNTLTPANVTIPSNINFDSGSLQINLSGQSNTDGNTSFTFGISSSNFPIYNADAVNGNTTITIYKAGDLPATPYIKFEDIKNFVRSNGWRGVATINVETRNSYGSKATTSATVNIDLRTNPTTVGSINVGGQTTVAGGQYYIPSRGSFNVSWSGASDKLGGSILYDLQGAYANGEWITLKADLNETSTQVNLEAVTNSVNYRFRVIAKTNFGYNSYSGETVITLHYYNQPKITIKNINRSATQFSAEVYTQTDTSITAVAINMRQWQDKNGTFHNFAGSPYRFTQDGLGETDSYIKQVKCSDNSGLPESTVTLNYQVSSYIPIVSIRKKGLGINDLADDKHKFKVNGNSHLKGELNVKGQISIDSPNSNKARSMYNMAVIESVRNGVNNTEVWLLINAWYDYNSKRFKRVNIDNFSFGWQMQAGGTYPGEEGYDNVNQGMNLWKANGRKAYAKDSAEWKATGEDIGAIQGDGTWREFGVMLGWNNVFMNDSYGGMTIGGAGFEVDGNGMSPFKRVSLGKFAGGSNSGLASQETQFAYNGTLWNTQHGLWNMDENRMNSYFYGLEAPIDYNDLGNNYNPYSNRAKLNKAKWVLKELKANNPAVYENWKNVFEISNEGEITLQGETIIPVQVKADIVNNTDYNMNFPDATFNQNNTVICYAVATRNDGTKIMLDNITGTITQYGIYGYVGTGYKELQMYIAKKPSYGVKLNKTYLDLKNGSNGLTLGIGDKDIYLHNQNSNKYLQLKNDGRLCYSDKEILDKGHFSTDRGLNGYQYLPNGLLMQWGYVSMGKDTTKLINLKRSFADNNYNLQVSAHGGPGRVPAAKTYYINKNNFYIQCEADFNVYWFAIGAV